ncbi:MAG: response regulator [Verrucomicrobiota bacterium]
MSPSAPILIVDDDADDIFILKRLLLKAGIKNKTVAFEDPRIAVAHLEAVVARGDPNLLPCLTFTDLHMPQMNGVEFTRWIRQQPPLDRLCVVMVSSSEDPRDAARAVEAGVSRFALKYPAASALRQIVDASPCTNASLSSP